MINLQKLTVKNFMSVGNVTQAIDFDRRDLTLVLGENMDLGGDGSRNGTGKTTIINALSFALYGNALTSIRKDNLINKTNGKNMLVSAEFQVDGVDYKIERGRKPNLLKFYINNQEKVPDDDAQGDSRETQGAIENILGMSHTMFQHIVGLNTYTLPFLSLKSNDQRAIIEQLLGITMLSEKADRIKELHKKTKDDIKQEEFRIQAINEANKRIEEQIENLGRRQKLWRAKHKEDLEELLKALQDLQNIDIDNEIQAHKDHESWDSKRKTIDDLNSQISRATLDVSREEKSIKKLQEDIQALEDHTCYACGQTFHDSKHEEVLSKKNKDLEDAKTQHAEHVSFLEELKNEIDDLGELGTPPKMFYDNEEDAIQHRTTLNTLEIQIETKQQEQDPYQDQIDDMKTQALQEVDYEELNRLTNLQEHQDFLLKLLTNKDSFIRKKIIDQNLSYLNQRLTHYLDRIGLPHSVVFQNDLSVEISELGRELDFDN